MTDAKRHAPKGPITRPIDAPTHDGRRRCTAHSSRTGKPCQRAPILGGTVCATHGGSAPQVKKAADERLAAMVDPAITRLNELMMQREFPTVAIAAVKDVLDRVKGKATENLNAHVSGKVSLEQLVVGALTAEDGE